MILNVQLFSLSLSLSLLPSTPLAEAAAREAALNANPLHGEYAPPPPSVIAPSRQSSAEARMQMMQQEEEEGEIEIHYYSSSSCLYCYGMVSTWSNHH